MATNQPKWCQVLGIDLPAPSRRARSAPSSDPTVSVGPTPTAVALTPSGSAAYVTDAGGAAFNVITNAPPYPTTQYPVGHSPFWVAITPTPPPGTPYAYITDIQDSTVNVVNTATNAVTATIDLFPDGTLPFGVAITPDGTKAFTANSGTANVSVIDTAANTVTGTIALPGSSAPYGVATSPTAPLALVTDSGTGMVSVIDTGSDAVIATITVGAGPFGVAVAPNGQRAYVANSGDGTVSVIDLTPPPPGPYPVTTVAIPESGILTGVAVAPDSGHVYVTDAGGSSVYVIDAATDLVASVITVGEGPLGVAVTPDGAFIYVADSLSDTVTIAPAVVLRGTTATMVGSAPDPSVFGEPKTLTATVTVTSGTGTPTGTVQFSNNGVELGAPQTLSAEGTAALVLPDLAVGSYSITAQYSGDANFAGSVSAADEQTVTRGGTETTLTSAPDPSTVGETVTLTAAVAVVPPAAGTPTGMVSFYDGLVLIGTQFLDASGTAELPVSTLTAGIHSLTALYNGDADFAPSVGTTSQTVDQVVSTATTLTAGPAVAVIGPDLLAHFTVSATLTTQGGVPLPGQRVTFEVGGTAVGSATTDSSGTAVSTGTADPMAILMAGSQYTAAFAGTPEYQASSATAPLFLG